MNRTLCSLVQRGFVAGSHFSQRQNQHRSALVMMGTIIGLACAPILVSAKSDAIILSQHQLQDPRSNAPHSHTILAPRGWKVEGGAWYAQGKMFNVFPSQDIRVIAPDGRQVHIAPAISAKDWIPAPGSGLRRDAEMLIAQGRPIMYMPTSLPAWAKFVREKSIAFEYPDATDVRVEPAEIAPDLTQQLRKSHAFAYKAAEQQNRRARANGARSHSFADAKFYTVKAHYTIANQRWDALYAFGITLSGFDSPQGRQIWWGIEPIYAFRAPEGRLEQAMPMLISVGLTVRATPQWTQWRTNQVAQIMKIGRQMAADNLRTAAKISGIMSQASNDVMNIINKGHRARNAITDKGQQRTVQTIRGTASFIAPGAAAPVELPADYSNVYSNGNGDFLLTNDRLYRPNSDSSLSGNWSRMQMQQ